MSIARKNLFAEKTRFAISVGGVAFAVLLILVLSSLYQGWVGKMAAYIEGVEADLWIMQEGASDMFHSISILPREMEGEISALEGVEEVHRLLGRQIAFEIDGKEVHTFLFGFHTEMGVGGPLRVIEGRDRPREGEIIIDRVFARNNALTLGDSLSIGDREFEVTGISEGGNLVIYQYAFIRQEDAEDLFRMENLTNYFLVSVEDSDRVQEVAQRISEEMPGTEALTKAEFAENNRKIMKESFLPILSVLVVIGFIIGVAVIGLTIYTATVEKSREYGVLKAIGARNLDLYKIVFEQSLTCGLLGFLVGVLLGWAVNAAAEAFVPEFVTYLRIQDIVGLLGATLLMSLLASYIPARRIAGIDPAVVFRA